MTFQKNTSPDAPPRCPVCGGTMIRGKRDYGCSNWREKDGACGFRMPGEMAGRPVAMEEVRRLLRESVTNVLDGFVREDGTSISGRLRLEHGPDGWQTLLEPVPDSGAGPDPAADPAAGGEALGVCPACGGELEESPRAYGCANWRDADGGCRVTVWKIIAGRTVSREEAKQLLAGETIGPFSDFVSRKGSPFTASIALEKIRGEWKTRLIFDNSSSGPSGSSPQEAENTAEAGGREEKHEAVLGVCPACGGDIRESDRAYGCANWKEEDGGCRFAIWKMVARRPVSADIARQLLQTGHTDELDGFVSRKGSSFSARLKLADSGEGFRVQFDFSD